MTSDIKALHPEAIATLRNAIADARIGQYGSKFVDGIDARVLAHLLDYYAMPVCAPQNATR